VLELDIDSVDTNFLKFCLNISKVFLLFVGCFLEVFDVLIGWAGLEVFNSFLFFS